MNLRITLPTIWYVAATTMVACSRGEEEHPVLWDPVLGETRQVVPGPGLPPGLKVQPANNNLDVVRHQRRAFLAFRTAPSHFASPETVVHVLSSIDEETWEHEASFHEGTDLREPSLLSFRDELFLYFSVLGEDALSFTPKGFKVARREKPGRWSVPQFIYRPGLVAWTTKVIAGVPYMLAYEGGEGLYKEDPSAVLRVHFLTTQDGFNWEPVVPGQPVVLTGGVSETDIAILSDGTLVAVGRNEKGDEDGWGSKVCRAEPGDFGNWRCRIDPRKFDSPLVFQTGDQVWLVARRNLSETGNYDLFLRDLPPSQQTIRYQLDFWKWPKRTSLWSVDPVSLNVTWIADLPSRGDTCFPALMPREDGTFRIYNYTSPLDGPDLSWIEGQMGPTVIVSTGLSFVPRGSRPAHREDASPTP